MKKIYVANDIQRSLLQHVLIQEMKAGFWKNAKPTNHVLAWDNVEIEVAQTFGVSGMELARNYNFLNPKFFAKFNSKLLQQCHLSNPNMTVNELKHELLQLNQILGGRLVSLDTPVTKLQRGKKTISRASTESVANQTTVRKSAALFA